MPFRFALSNSVLSSVQCRTLSKLCVHAEAPSVAPSVAHVLRSRHALVLVLVAHGWHLHITSSVEIEYLLPSSVEIQHRLLTNPSSVEIEPLLLLTNLSSVEIEQLLPPRARRGVHMRAGVAWQVRQQRGTLQLVQRLGAHLCVICEQSAASSKYSCQVHACVLLQLTRVQLLWMSSK